MIPKSVIESVVAKQWKRAEETPVGFNRQLSDEIPYLGDRALVIGGMRGSGRSSLMVQLLHGEYHKAWYTRFDDPRLAGFDRNDFIKLDLLIRESGRGVLLLDKVDCGDGWHEFITDQLSKGIKVIATVSLDTLRQIQSRAFADSYLTKRLDLLTYNEYCQALRKRGGESAVNEYIACGAFPAQVKTSRSEVLLQMYDEIVAFDVLLAKGVRDYVGLKQTALHLFSECCRLITANSLKVLLKVKAVSTVVEHLSHLEASGLISFVPLLSDNLHKQAVNPRKVYVTDTALCVAVARTEVDRNRLFENVVFNHLKSKYNEICYTTAEGGCDFVIREEGAVVAAVQACYDADIDTLETKGEGLFAVLSRYGLKRGVIVSLSGAESITRDDMEIDVIDADSFLSE